MQATRPVADKEPRKEPTREAWWKVPLTPDRATLKSQACRRDNLQPCSKGFHLLPLQSTPQVPLCLEAPPGLITAESGGVAYLCSSPSNRNITA